MIPLSRYDKLRISPPTFWMGAGGRGDDICGAFEFKQGKARLRVIATAGDDWEHVSVSLEKRCPTWEEMAWIGRKFFGPDAYAMQLMVPVTEHISHHPYCLHWWRPVGVEIPVPPHWMVAPNEGEILVISEGGHVESITG